MSQMMSVAATLASQLRATATQTQCLKICIILGLAGILLFVGSSLSTGDSTRKYQTGMNSWISYIMISSGVRPQSMDLRHKTMDYHLVIISIQSKSNSYSLLALTFYQTW